MACSVKWVVESVALAATAKRPPDRIWFNFLDGGGKFYIISGVRAKGLCRNNIISSYVNQLRE